MTLLAGCGRVAFDPRAVDSGTTDTSSRIACGTESSLVACYALDGDGTDSSGRGNHATGSLGFEPGHFAQAGSFKTTLDVRVADTPSLEITAVTIMAWVRLDAAPVDMRSVVFDKRDAFALYVRNDLTLGVALATTGTSGGANDPNTFPLGTWTHVAVSYGNNFVALYRDGVVVDTNVTVTGPIGFGDTQGSRLGGNMADTASMDNEAFVGAIDELGIWSEALPEARVTAAAAE